MKRRGWVRRGVVIYKSCGGDEEEQRIPKNPNDKKVFAKTNNSNKECR